MKITNKQKSELLNSLRSVLAKQHWDSKEYTDHTKLSELIEENTQSALETIRAIEDTAIYSVIGNLRHAFRKIRWDVILHEDLDEDSEEYRIMMRIYDFMMQETKKYIPSTKCGVCNKVLTYDEKVLAFEVYDILCFDCFRAEMAEEARAYLIEEGDFDDVE